MAYHNMHRYKQRKDRQHSEWDVTVKLLSLSIGRNRGEVAEVVISTSVGDGFEVFRITTVGNADTDVSRCFAIFTVWWLQAER